MSFDRAQFEGLLDAYLAGELQGEELARFEAMLKVDPVLRAEVELQRAIDNSLRASCAAPADFAQRLAVTATSAVPQLTAAQRPMPKTSPWTRRFAIAAMLVLGVFGAWNIWQFVKPQPAPYPDTGPRRTLEVAYHEIIDDGFEPAWICRNDQEFLENVRKSLGKDLLIAQVDPGVRVLGLAYANTISPWTVMILAYVDGKPVVVFADRSMADRQLPQPAPGLTLHKREIGEIVLYELSPHKEARVLPQIYEPVAARPSA